MQKFWITLFGAFTLTLSLNAQECSHQWQYDLVTNSTGPKSYTGDSNAAYAVFKFKADDSKWFRLKGKFPRARFLSIESYSGYKNHGFQSIFDWQIEPDSGSENPFREGVAIDTENRSYTISVAPESSGITGENSLALKEGQRIVSIWVRYYAPNQGIVVTPDSLPTIEAFDVETGVPASCPESLTEVKKNSLPPALSILAPRRREPFSFKSRSVDWAGNAAVPGYSYGVSKMGRDEVIVAKFRAPKFTRTYDGTGPFHNDGDVRYWSICSVNLVQNIGLACLPDYAAKIDKDGFVTVVHSVDRSISGLATQRGHNYVPDNRKANQRMVLLTYRNVLSTDAFAEHYRYKGDYNPRAVICSVVDYRNGNCEP